MDVNVKRINHDHDSRCSQKVLNQYGTFLVLDKYLYEAEILNLN